MKKGFAAGLVLFTLMPLFSGEDCRVSVREIADGVAEYSLSNGLFEIKCVPETSALISGLTFRPENRKMIHPLECIVEKDDLLPTRCHTNTTGFRETAVGNKLNIHTKYRPDAPACIGETAELVMRSRGFYKWNIDAEKKIVLRKGETRAKTSLTLTAAADMTAPIHIWINGVASMGEKERDIVMLPVRNVSENRMGLAMAAFSCDGVYFDQTGALDVRAAANAPWIAQTSSERPGVLAVRLGKNFVEGGVLYSWKNGNSPIHTAEAIFSPLKLKKGETRTFTVEYLYFEKLTGLHDTVGPFGLDREPRAVFVASVAPVPAGVMTLNWRAPDGRTGNLGEFPLPPLNPREFVRIDLEKFSLPEKCTLFGTLPGGLTFELPERIDSILER
ncbi:MAG: hypothetical protein J5944_04380 [Lentisphaeria bacterium]|nr:hypothetical protein [Lentisphaeria bacterium]